MCFYVCLVVKKVLNFLCALDDTLCNWDGDGCQCFFLGLVDIVPLLFLITIHMHDTAVLEY